MERKKGREESKKEAKNEERKGWGKGKGQWLLIKNMFAQSVHTCAHTLGHMFTYIDINTCR